jgi:hypothetical protein
MKRVYFAAIFLLCISVLFCSCNKEGNGSTGMKLEGKWWVIDVHEELFNGKVVLTNKTGLINRIYFSDGNATIEGDDGWRSVVSYSVIDDEIVLQSFENYSIRLVSGKLVFEKKLSRQGNSELPLTDIRRIFTYDGEPLYSSMDDLFDLLWPWGKIDPCYYSSNLNPCCLVGLQRVKSEYFTPDPYVEYANDIDVEIVNDKEFVLYYYAGEIAYTYTFDYVYDSLKDTFRQE